MMEDRPLLKAETRGLGTVDFRAGNVCGQQVRGELNTMKVRLDGFGQGFYCLGFSQSRCTLQKKVTASEQADQHALYQRFLTEDLLGHEGRSEEHTSELQSRPHLVCRLQLEK